MAEQHNDNCRKHLPHLCGLQGQSQLKAQHLSDNKNPPLLQSSTKSPFQSKPPRSAQQTWSNQVASSIKTHTASSAPLPQPRCMARAKFVQKRSDFQRLHVTLLPLPLKEVHCTAFCGLYTRPLGIPCMLISSLALRACAGGSMRMPF